MTGLSDDAEEVFQEAVDRSKTKLVLVRFEGRDVTALTFANQTTSARQSVTMMQVTNGVSRHLAVGIRMRPTGFPEQDAMALLNPDQALVLIRTLAEYLEDCQ